MMQNGTHILIGMENVDLFQVVFRFKINEWKNVSLVVYKVCNRSNSFTKPFME